MIPDSVATRLTKYDAHAFQPDPKDQEIQVCEVCGEKSVRVIHHPTRVRAALELLEAVDEAEAEAEAERNRRDQSA